MALTDSSLLVIIEQILEPQRPANEGGVKSMDGSGPLYQGYRVSNSDD